jgi:formate hydrogenlyase subunit 6/NADH:ubiquinone oxidoreductase subunit I
MNILSVLLGNFQVGSRTLRPEDEVKYPTDFRGELSHSTEVCIVCGACAYTCSPGAIILSDQGELVTWTYKEDQCTFCGRCVEYCPTRALVFKQNAPAPTQNRSQHYLIHSIELPICSQCGKPFRRLPAKYLSEKSPEMSINQKLLEELCEDCRRREYGSRVMNNFNDKRGDYGY